MSGRGHGESGGEARARRGRGGTRRGGRAREDMWRCMTRRVSVSTPNDTSSDNLRRPKTYGCFCPVVCFPLKGDAWGVPILDSHAVGRMAVACFVGVRVVRIRRALVGRSGRGECGSEDGEDDEGERGERAAAMAATIKRSGRA
jgi:hypothetical protein